MQGLILTVVEGRLVPILDIIIKFGEMGDCKFFSLCNPCRSFDDPGVSGVRWPYIS